jgi:phosphoglycolate phosphatase-like HAD superfamily hydrolase
MVRHVPPFPFVRECLERLEPRADLMVCSATPVPALEAEWREHGIARYVTAIRGQEDGTKSEFLGAGKHYPPQHVLMIGDAPGDYAAARANDALFFPINPGAEEASWERLYKEGLERLLQGEFAGAYQDSLLADFDHCLPEQPTWKRG